MTPRRVAPVMVFWLIACAISWPFMILLTQAPAIWQAIPLPGFFKASLFMWGPGIAALICYRVFRDRVSRRTTLLGHSRLSSLTALLVPMSLLGVAILVVTGVQQVILFAALMVPVGIFNTLGEELGWRGYLQDALDHHHPAVAFLAVGILWELWHLPMRVAVWQAAPWIGFALAAGSILLAFIAGYLVRYSGAVMLGVTVHMIANIVATDEIGQIFGVERPALLAIAAISLVVAVALTVRRAGRPPGRRS